MGFIKCTAGALLDLSPDSINRSDEELQKKPEILILAGSIRTGSFSQRFADAYAGNLVNHECVITRVTLSDYPLPMMNEDLEKEERISIRNFENRRTQLNIARDSTVKIFTSFSSIAGSSIKNLKMLEYDSDPSLSNVELLQEIINDHDK